MEQVIDSKEELIETVQYVATEATALAHQILGKTFPISSLTVFAHSQEEYLLLVAILAEMGEPFNEQNGPRVALHEPLVVGRNTITHLRIRQPDSERPQVGCCDFDTDYAVFDEEYLKKFPQSLTHIMRPGYEMIEFHDPEFDVLAYVVSTEEEV